MTSQALTSEAAAAVSPSADASADGSADSSAAAALLAGAALFTSGLTRAEPVTATVLIAIILALLLRALVAPVYLVVAVLLGFTATLAGFAKLPSNFLNAGFIRRAPWMCGNQVTSHSPRITR